MIYSDIKTALDNASQCIVCGRVASYRGVYIPDEPGHPAPPEGTTRHIIYGLCRQHIEIARLVGDAVQAQFELDYGNFTIQ